MIEKKIFPAYRIHTSRLLIRCWDPADAVLLKDAIDASRDHLSPWMPWAQGDPEPLEPIIERLRTWRGKFDLDLDYVYGIFSSDESAVIGSTGLHTRVGPSALEIGYWIHSDHLRKGYATEITAALTKVAFEIHHVNRVEIHCDPKNIASAAIPEKLGYTLEATLKQRFKQSENEWRDAMIWTLFANQYPQSPSAHILIKTFDAFGRHILECTP